MEEFNYALKIPKERVAILIGAKGETKRKIEQTTNTKIQIDSKEGEVTISGQEALGLFSAREVVEAIGRGFSPEYAEMLLKGDYVLDIINIKDFAKTKTTFMRLKGRVIGKEGKSRRTIEGLTETYITVYGKTIGIIGEADDVLAARKAIESLLRGAPHANVYKSLERRRKIKGE